MGYQKEFIAGYNYAKKVYTEAEDGFAKKKAMSRIYSEFNSTSKHFPFNKGMAGYYYEKRNGKPTTYKSPYGKPYETKGTGSTADGTNNSTKHD